MLHRTPECTASQSNATASKACDLCGGEQFEPLAHYDRHGEPLDTDLCLSCGLVMHATIPTQDELDAFYGSKYRVAYHGEITPSDRRVWRAWNNGLRIAKRLRPVLNPESPVLEVGAGIGCTVRALCNQGLQAEGIEPNIGFQRYASSKLHVPVIRKSLDDLPQLPRYGAILLVHVIEHLRSPARALRQLHALLDDDGVLYLECPNLAGPFATPKRLFHYAHIHNFTPETLRLLASRCGFTLEQSYVSEGHPELQMRFRKVAQPQPLPIPSGAAERTRKAAFRLGTTRYHLRPTYLVRRLEKLTRYANEHLWARGRVKTLLQHSTAQAMPSPFLQATSGRPAQAFSTINAKAA